MEAKLISADFEENTMEFEIQHEFTANKGDYVILTKDEHTKMEESLYCKHKDECLKFNRNLDTKVCVAIGDDKNTQYGCFKKMKKTIFS